MGIFLLDLLFVAPVILPIPNTKVEYSSFYKQLQVDPDFYGVFDFPSRRDRTSLLPTEYFFYQSMHYRPIPYAIMNSWIDMDDFWGELTRIQQSGGDRTPTFDNVGLSNARQRLIKKNYRYFLLHKKLLNQTSKNTFLALFTDMFGSPMYEDEYIWVFRIGT